MTETTTARPTPTPSAPRRRVRVPLLAAGVVLVLFAGLLVLWGFSQVADRNEVLMLNQPVAAGAPIPASALSTTFVAVDDGTARFYPVGTDLSDVVAATDLAAGDVLTPSMIAATPNIPDGWNEIGAVIRAGRYPSTSNLGDDLFAVPTEGPDEITVTVVDFNIADDDSAEVVLAVPAGDAARVAQWAASDDLVLVRVP